MISDKTTEVRQDATLANNAGQEWVNLSIEKWFWGLFVVGALLRLRQYLFNKSLWLDESALSLNIIERDFWGLIEPLGYNQMAPIGFLLSTKFPVMAFGPSEYALRAFALLASLVGLFFFGKFLKRFNNPTLFVIGFSLFVFSFRLTYYAAEVKQYASDVMVGSIFLYMYLRKELLQENLLKVALLGILGSLLIWFSHPSIFILAGIGIFLLLSANLRLIGHWYRLVALGLPWAASFLIEYVLFLGKDPNNEGMQAYWQHAFAPFPPQGFGDFEWYLNSIEEIFFYTVGIGYAGQLLLLLALVAVWSGLAKKDFRPLGLLTPLLLLYLASAFKMYPLSQRLLLFLTPLVAALLAWGAWAMISHLSSLALQRIVLAFLFVQPLLFTAACFVKPIQEEEIREVLAHYQKEHQEGDAIFLYHQSEMPFRYYQERFVEEGTNVEVGPEQFSEAAYAQQIAQLEGSGRIWMIITHDYAGHEQFIVEQAKLNGTLLQKKIAKGAAAYLFEF